ncbi:MAG: hypothetical protein QOH56_57, partial [Pseudonocardiales bacterium]|nr:hypothetical protein [Pseudonocardiales bacterium]
LEAFLQQDMAERSTAESAWADLATVLASIPAVAA